MKFLIKIITFSLIIISIFHIECIAENSLKTLERAYKKNSVKLLEQFCNNWSKEIGPISDSEYASLNDTLKNTYDLFKIYFTRKYNEDISQEKSNFIVLPDKIIISFKNEMRDTIRYTYQIDTIFNFHPSINLPDKQILFLSNNYQTIINNYLIGEYSQSSEIRDFSKYYDSRIAFIVTCIIPSNQCARVRNKFQSPTPNIIVFDKQMKYAKVSCGGSFSLFKHQENNWVYISSGYYFVD
jgi:hypothetical protein